MSKITDKIKHVIGKEDKFVLFPIRIKESRREQWKQLAKINGFESASAMIKFLMHRAENEPEKPMRQ